MEVGFQINAKSASTLHYGGNSFSSYAVPISSRPFFGNVLNARVPSKFQALRYRKLNFGPLSASLNGASNAGLISDALLPKDLEFKPSFDEYLKAMESARNFKNNKKDASSSTTTQKQMMRERGEKGNQKSKRVEEKIDGKDGFEAAKALKVGEKVMYKEGSSAGDNITVRGRKSKGFKNKYDGKESKFDVKGKQKHGANVRENGGLKHRSHSLQPEEGWMRRQSQGKSGSGRISNNITRFNSNNRPGRSTIESSGENVVISRQRDYNTQGKAPGGNKIVASNKVMDRGIGRRSTEIKSVINRNGQENVKLNRSSKHFIVRGYDSDNLAMERAAFMNFGDANDVIGRPQFSHKEMEERIQKLSRLYVIHSL